jgi:hypothetical protein
MPKRGLRAFLQRPATVRWLDFVIGWASLGSVWVHEFGHRLAAGGTDLEPAILYLDATLAPNGLPREEEDGYSGWRRWLAVLSAIEGRVIFAGSPDLRTGKLVPLSPGKRALNTTAPGCVEARVAIGGPALQLMYGAVIAVLTWWGHAHWFPLPPYLLVPKIFDFLSLMPLVPALVNILRAIHALRPFVSGDWKSDGWYVWKALTSRSGAAPEAGDA